MREHLIALSDSDLQSLSAAIRSNRLHFPVSAIALQRLLPIGLVPNVAEDLQQLLDLGFGAQQVAAALDLIVQDRRRRLVVDEVVDLVTTGPEPGGVTNRDTSVVVRELFCNANQTVLLAGYAVYQGQKVFQALADRMQELPNLQVRLFLDIQRPKDDATAADLLVSKFNYRFRQYQWPVDRPVPEVYYYPASLEISDKHSCLHAKCVVVDGHNVFVSSANFTEAAHDRNIEMGLLLKSKLLGKQIVNHFESLISSGDMRKLV